MWHLYPVCDCSRTDPLPGMQTSINPVDGTFSTLTIANLYYKHEILRHFGKLNL